MKIIFVRHGNDKNGKLTRLGRKQAKLVVKELTYENIAYIFASPLERTAKTAEIIARGLKIKNITFDERLTEREKIPDDLPFERKQKLMDNYLNPTFSSPRPEGCKEYVQRIFSFLDEQVKCTKDEKNILIVGHSSMTYVLGAYFYNLPKDKKLIWSRIGNCSKLCYEYFAN